MTSEPDPNKTTLAELFQCSSIKDPEHWISLFELYIGAFRQVVIKHRDSSSCE
jgi:hypothetical protein